MSVRDLYPSKSNYLKCKDLNGKQIKVSISGVEVANFDDGPKLCLSFNGTEKKLTLNKTNADTIASAFGDDETAWVGKKVVLSPAKTKFQGNIVDTIRVTPEMAVVEGFEPVRQPEPPANHPAVATPPSDLDDSIPF